jgi:hypothetical protein
MQTAQCCAEVGLVEIWSVFSIETSGCGFLTDRRPKILFERHIFSRLTNGRYHAQDPDITAPSAGRYGAGGANQYDRLASAIQLDREAALQSASWGLGQIMGENFQEAGFGDIEKMVSNMVSGEDAQLLAVAEFLKAIIWISCYRHTTGPNLPSTIMDRIMPPIIMMAYSIIFTNNTAMENYRI